MTEKNIAVGMSGGVDSSVAAHLLTKSGYNVHGVNFIMNSHSSAKGACEVCAALGIPFFKIDEQDNFKKSVISNFVSEYISGRTPNPCVVCNRMVKFPSLISFADKNNCDFIATGHYAKIEKNAHCVTIKKATDRSKDQSYMLWGLTKDIISRTVFPLGDLTKSQIREIALENRLPSAAQKDSQDICFIPDGNYISFLEENAEIYNTGFCPHSGNYILKDNTVVGQHNGHYTVTLGQTRGLGVALGKKMYVTRKNPVTNEITLGDKSELYVSEIHIGNINLINGDISDFDTKQRLACKTRYTQNEFPATVQRKGDNELSLIFDTPVKAPSPGQSAVMYDGECMIGGGIIL